MTKRATRPDPSRSQPPDKQGGENDDRKPGMERGAIGQDGDDITKWSTRRRTERRARRKQNCQRRRDDGTTTTQVIRQQ